MADSNSPFDSGIARTVEELDQTPFTNDRAQMFDRTIAEAANYRDRNQLQDTAVGVLDTLQSIGSIPLAVLPNYELADAARNSQILDQLRSPAYLQERKDDAAAIRQATEEGGEWAGLIEGVARTVSGGNTFADVMAQSPYLMIGPAARAMGFAAAGAVPGVVGRGLAAIGGTSEAAIINRVAALSGILEGTSSYGQTYERVLRETGDVEEATRQAQIAGGTALLAGLALGKATPGFELDPLGRNTNITSRFLGDAVLPTASAVGAEVLEEGGMALTNTVTDNVLNGRNPMEGVGGAVGEAAAISSLFTGGLRSPSLIRDLGSAIGQGVVKGLKGIGEKAVTPEGSAVSAASAANAQEAAAAFDARINEAMGGDPASTAAATETATAGSSSEPAPDTAVSEAAPSTEETPTQPTSTEEKPPIRQQYQLRLGEPPAREINPTEVTEVDTVLTMADTEAAIAQNTDENGEVNQAGAAAVIRASDLVDAGKVTEAEATIEQLSQDPKEVEKVVEAASQGDTRAQNTVEAIAQVNVAALPDETIPAIVRPFVQALRALKLPKRAEPGSKLDGIQRTREQLLNSGWVNTITGKAAARKRGMRDHVNGIITGLTRAGVQQDTKTPIPQAVAAASFLQHLQQRAQAFADTLALADELDQQREKHPLWQETLATNYLEVEGTQTLSEDGKRTGPPFKLWLSGKGREGSRATVQAVFEDILEAEKMWDVFAQQYPQMAEEAARQAGLKRQKIQDIIDFRKARKAEAQQQKDERAERRARIEAQQAERKKANDEAKAKAAEAAARKAEAQKLAEDTLEQEVAADIESATTLDELRERNKSIVERVQKLRPEQQANLRKAYAAKNKALKATPPPAATATPAPQSSATDKTALLNRIKQYLTQIRNEVKDLKWDQVGGQLIIDGEGKKSRSTWLTSSPWWARSLGLSMKDTLQLFKGLSTVTAENLENRVKQLGKNQTAVLNAFFDFLEGEQREQDRREAETRAAEETARKEKEAADAEARAEREAIQAESRAAEEAERAKQEADAARARAAAESAGVSDTGTDSDTAERAAEAVEAVNPLTQVNNWLRDFTKYFNVDPKNTVKGWIDQIKALGTSTARVGRNQIEINIWEDLYRPAMVDVYRSLTREGGILKQGVSKINTEKGDKWQDKVHGVGSFLWTIVGKAKVKLIGSELETDVYGVPDEVAQAFALAGVIVMYKNIASFREVLTEKGTLAREVQKEAWASDIAKLAMKLLGVSAKKDASTTIGQGAFLAYGLSTVAALIEGKTFEMAEGFDPNKDSYTNDNLRTEVAAQSEDQFPRKTQILVPNESALLNTRAFTGAIDEVQGILDGERIWEVSSEPITEVDGNVQYSDIPTSTAQKTAEKNLQSVKHSLFQGFFNLYDTLGEDGMLGALTGWWDELPKPNEGTVPETVRDWLKSQQIRLQAEFQAIQKYMEVTENGAKGLYYKYHWGLNGRPKTVMGPQNNKVIRDMFSSGEVTLDLTVQAQREAIEMALAQAFGIKTDINNKEQVLQLWNEQKAEHIARANAIRAAGNNKELLKAALRQNNDKPYSPRQLAALVTLAEMEANPNNTAFTTHLMFEIDGKTNGAFNTELFFGLAVHSRANLGQGGFFQGKHDASWESERNDLETNTGGIDFYERLNKGAEFQYLRYVVKKLSEDDPKGGKYRFMLGSLKLLEAAGLVEVDWSQDKAGNYLPWTMEFKDYAQGTTEKLSIPKGKSFPRFKFKRDAAKLAVIPIQYGAGITGISSQLWSDVVTKINANWLQLHNKLERTTDKAERTKLMAQMSVLASQLKGYDTRGVDVNKLPDEEKFDALRWNITLQNLAKAMNTAYSREKSTVQYVTRLLVKISTLAYNIKKVQFDRAVEAAKLEMPENQALIEQYGLDKNGKPNVRLYDLSPAKYREILGQTLDMRFSAYHAPKSISLNTTEWNQGGVNVVGIGTPMDANLDVPVPAAPGVSLLALMTIAGGDAAMGTEFFQQLRQVTHVFDGYDMNVLDREAFGAALNEAVWKTAGFDILQDVATLIDRMGVILSTAGAEDIDAFTDAYNAELPSEIKEITGDEWLELFNTSVEEFKAAHHAQKVGVDTLKAQPNTVYQMGGGAAFNTPVIPLKLRDRASLEDDFQLSLEEDLGRAEVVDLSQSGRKEEGNFPDDYKHPEATRIEDEGSTRNQGGFIDVIMKGPRWKGKNTKTYTSSIVDGKSAGLRRLLKVLFMAAEAGVAYDSDKSVHPSAIRMYMRGKRMGLLTFESRFTDAELNEAGRGSKPLRTDDNSSDDGEPVFRNVRLLGRNSLGATTPDPGLLTSFEVTGNTLNRANVIAALDQVKWKNNVHRQVWRMIRNLLPADLEVKLASTEEAWNTATQPRGIRRVFNSVTATALGSYVVLRVPSPTVMLHELLHTIFTQHIDNFFSNINQVPVELRGPINDLVQLMEKFKRLAPTGRVGFVQRVMASYAFRGQPQDELGEMLAYVFTEDEVIEQLSPGFVQRVINRVKQVLRYFIRLEPAHEFYNEAMDVFRSLASNVPQDAAPHEGLDEMVHDHLPANSWGELGRLSAQAFIDLIHKATYNTTINLQGLEKETQRVLAQAQATFALDPNQQLMFNRLYMLLRKGVRPGDLDQFVTETFPKSQFKDMFPKTPDLVAAVMALAAVEPTFGNALNQLWQTRPEAGQVDALIDKALNHAQASSFEPMLNEAVAAMLLEQERQASLYGTAVSRIDRFGRGVINRLGEMAGEAAQNAPQYADTVLQGIGALLNEKRATVFGEDLVAKVNATDQRWLQDMVAAFTGTKGSGKFIYRARIAMQNEINRLRSAFDNTLPRELSKLFPKDFDGWNNLFEWFGRLDVQVLGTSAGEMYLNDQERRRMITVLESKVDNYHDAQNLAYYLVHRETKPGVAAELLSNAAAIADKVGTADYQRAPESLVEDVDQLVTLYAIEYLSKDQRAKIASYFRTYPDSMNKLVGMMKHVKDAEKQQNRNEYRYAYWKDSLPLSMDPRSSVVIANSVQGAKYEALGYLKKQKYQQGSGDPETDLYYYVRKYSPPPVFTQGIIATVQQTNMGVNYTTAATITPEVGTMITQKPVVSYIQRTKGVNSKLRAIYNFEGELVGYERLLDPKIVREALSADKTQLHVSIGKRLGRITEEALARRINQEAIKLMVNQWKTDEAAGRGDEYEPVDSSPDKQVARAWETIPADIKNQLQEAFNGPVMIRKDLVSNALGYHNMGALELITGDASIKPETRKVILGIIQTVFFGPKGMQIFLAAEQAIKEGVATARDIIIVRSLVVAWQNAQASIHMVLANGVPPAKIIKWYRQGLREMRVYNELERQVMQLRIEIAGTTDPKERERLRTLQTAKRNSIKRLSIYPLIEAGELSDLPEGLEDTPSHSYLGDIAGWMDKHLREKIHPKAPKILANALFAKDSALHDALSKSIQAGDFLGRYAVYQHMLENGFTPDAARDEVRDEFIAYQANPGRMRAGLETYGMLWWSQFTLRAQNVLLNRFRKNPFSFFLSQGVGQVLGTPGPLDGAIYERGLDNSTGLDQVWNSPSAYIYAKVV